MWRLGRVEGVITSSDGGVRGARIRVRSKKGRSTVLRRPIQLLYPLKVCCDKGQDSSTSSAEVTNTGESDRQPDLDNQDTTDHEETPTELPDTFRGRNPRLAALHARDRILGCTYV